MCFCDCYKYIVIQNIQKLLNFVYRVTETTTTGQFSGQKSTQTGFFCSVSWSSGTIFPMHFEKYYCKHFGLAS